MQGREVDRFIGAQRNRPAEGKCTRSVAQRVVWMGLQCGPRAHDVLPMDTCPALLLRLVSVGLSIDTGLKSEDRLSAKQPAQDVIADAGGFRRLRSEHFR